MDKSRDFPELTPFMSLITGILVSTGFTLFLFFGVALSCTYLLQVTLTLTGVIIISSLIFWFNLKQDNMSDLMNIISSTVSFDFRFSRTGTVISLLNILKRTNPFIGALATFSGMLVPVWLLPAIILNVFSTPETSDVYLSITVFLMSMIICTAYYVSNTSQYSRGLCKILFFAGVLAGISGVLKILATFFA
jgi:hypothetical protein